MDEVKIRAAQERQRIIDRVREVGALAAEIEDLRYDQGEDLARERAEARARANPALADLVDPMITSGDAWSVAVTYGAVPVSKIGDEIALDPHVHTWPTGASVGDVVIILRQAFTWVVEGIVIERATVFPA